MNKIERKRHNTVYEIIAAYRQATLHILTVRKLYRKEFMNKFIYPILLLVLGCQDNEIKTSERTYIHDSSLDEKRLRQITIQIDSVLSDVNLSKIDTNIIYISQVDSTLNIEFKRKDTIEYYLTPHYQVFTNSLGYRLSNKNILTITSYDNHILSKYEPLDSIVYKTEISSDDPSYVSLTVSNPITSEQSHDVAKYMDFILGYMTYETDSAFFIYLFG